MPQNPHAEFDLTVIELIERRPGGLVPSTPAYQDALTRLLASHQVYADADHKDGYVSSRSLAGKPLFYAANVPDLLAGGITAEALESNNSIFDRYIQSLPEGRRAAAEVLRMAVAGRPVHHRPKVGGIAVHDLVKSLFLVPGSGPHPGLPGNYLYGSVHETGSSKPEEMWAVHLHDGDDGAARWHSATMIEAFAKLQEVCESAPFKMDELEALGFVLV